MTPTRLLPLLAAALQLVACAGTPPATPEAADALATFVIVRHGEKLASPDPDPGLAAEGLARAGRLARSLADEPLVAVYTTDYRRTRATVQPAARLHDLQPLSYDAHMSARELAARLMARHRSGTVLVAGHSNTVPAIVAALCTCATTAMAESEYDRISIVRIDHAGRPSLEVRRDTAAGEASKRDDAPARN